MPVPLVVIESPYRETVRPLRALRAPAACASIPGDVISIVIPEYVVEHWWQNLLHNQTALRLKGRLLFEPSVTVTSVPWVLGARTEGSSGADELGRGRRYVRSEDLLDESAPRRLARGPDAAAAAAASSPGWRSRLVGAAAADPAARRRSGPAVARRARCCSTCSRSWSSPLVGGIVVAVGVGGRRGAADQLLLRRARSTR